MIVSCDLPRQATDCTPSRRCHDDDVTPAHVIITMTTQLSIRNMVTDVMDCLRYEHQQQANYWLLEYDVIIVKYQFPAS